MEYVHEFKQNLISLSMFGGLGYCISIEHGMLKKLYGVMIIAKGTKMCSLYIFYGYTVIGHAYI